MAVADRRRALAFGKFAEEYALWRPTYPMEAVEWLVPEHASHVADVVAGTGKLTGALLERDLTVDAVELDPGLGEEANDSEPELAPSFPPEETGTATFPWTWEMTPEHLRAYVATNSAFATMAAAEREQRLDQARAIVTSVCREAGRATAPLQHEAFCFRWQPS